MAFGRFVRFDVLVGTGALIQTTAQTSVSHNGSTWTFDRAMPVGAFVTGEPFVVSNQAFQITGITPGGGNSFGVMKNPDGTSASQGFDDWLNQWAAPSRATPYSATLNVHPGVGGAVDVELGEEASFVQGMRGASSPGNWPIMADYNTLTVLSSAPPEGAYMPGSAGTSKTIRTRADVDFTSRGLPVPTGLPNGSALISNIPASMGMYRTNLEKLRAFRPSIAGSTSGYSADFVQTLFEIIYALNCNVYSAAQEQQVIDWVMTNANQFEAMIDQGVNLLDNGAGDGTVPGQGGAGQGGGWWIFGMAAAMLTRDASLMAKFRGHTKTQVEVPLWVSSDMVGREPDYVNGRAQQTYFDAHVGMPHGIADEDGSFIGGRYTNALAKIVMCEAMAVMAFDQGPPGYANGYEAILNGGPDDTSNRWAAIPAFVNRVRTWLPEFWGSWQKTTAMRNAFTQLQGLYTFRTFQPDEPVPYGAFASLDDYFNAGNGAVNFALDAEYDYSVLPITRWDMRVSLDGSQWWVASDVSPGHSFGGLIKGAPHWCGVRATSAAGTGHWLSHHVDSTPIQVGPNAAVDRWISTPTGTNPNTAPSYSGGLAPKVLTRGYPVWFWKIWEETTEGQLLSNAADDRRDEAQLKAGVGYPNGATYPAPSFAFQWQRSANGTSGWSNISGASSAEYNRTGADNGQYLRCRVTASNSQGSDASFTNVVAVP